MIEVQTSGVQSCIQDAGRRGYRHLGIPSSGAADTLSFAIANFMVGNPHDAAAVECALGGLRLKFNKDTHIAIAGADMNAQLNGRPLKNFTHAPVAKGSELTLGPAKNGARAYVAMQGGLNGEAFLGSVATYPLAKLGGLSGRMLRPGDHITLAGNESESPQALPAGFAPRISGHVVLRVRPGPEIDFITDIGKRELFIRPFTATRATDRMGSRLDGAKIDCAPIENFVSSPILPGTLQIPMDRRPILALTDGHCTGGYPRAAQVIRADLWQLGQIAPGTKISFHRCFNEDAPEILNQRNALFGNLIDGFQF